MSESLTKEELLLMRKAGKVASKILKALRSFIKPGITTKSIEDFFNQQLAQHPGMEPAFLGFMGYPASLCVSLNEEVIHGIPSDRQIKRGDLVSVDLGIKYKGLFVDAAYTYIAGRASRLAKRLVKVSQRALSVGINSLGASSHVGDIGWAVQGVVEKNGFAVIRKFVGHGIGRSLHLPPEVPNFGSKHQGSQLCTGLAIAVEPMVSAGSFEVDILADGWTAVTRDKSLSAHFEHTVAVTPKGPWILTQ